MPIGYWITNRLVAPLIGLLPPVELVRERIIILRLLNLIVPGLIAVLFKWIIMVHLLPFNVLNIQ